MKKLNCVAAVLVFGITAVCTSCIIQLSHVMGNGSLATSERSVSPFHKINCSSSADVRFYESQEYRAVITVDSNLIEYVEVFVQNDVLIISTKSRQMYSFTKFLVEVYCPVLTSVSLSGSGYFKGMNAISTPVFSADVSGSGTIEGTIVCNTFSAGISGSGRMNISGRSKDAHITISGSGTFHGNDFDIDNASVKISGSGRTHLYVTHNLNANVSGSGEIYYRGNPRINSVITGSGRIRRT